MKINFKPVALFALSVAVLAGCGGNAGSSASPEYNLQNVTFPLQEKVTLNFITQSSPLAPSDPNEKLIYQRLEEHTGVHINWKNYTSDSFTEKRNLAVASGDLPDAIMDAGYTDYELLQLGSDGTIVPVEELIEQHMPNLKKVLDEAPEYKAMITAPDGHIYAFPWIEELGSGKESIHSVNGMAWINMEWLNKLGLDMPSTTEELKNALLAFKQDDPNGNGEADEIPMSFIMNNGNEDMNFLFGTFGFGDNGDHTEKLVPHMEADHNYPPIFFSLEDQKQLSTIETDLFAYVNRKRAEWIKNGNVDAEWNEYLQELNRLGLDRWLAIKQKGYDSYTNS